MFFNRIASGGIPRGIATGGPALLSYGFRPFFLLAGVWAVLAMALWIGALVAGWPIGGLYGGSHWHAHEMVFGYTSAALAGFMLTAIPNWTGRLPVSGAPLLVLVLVWLAGRLAMLAPDVIGLKAAVLVEAAFLPALLLVALREIVAGRNWKNLKIAVALGVLCAANAWFHLAVLYGGDVALPGRLAIAAWVALIAIVGGRLLPSFTRNWLARRGAAALPAPFDNFDRLVLVVLVPVLALWAAMPLSPLTGVLCAAAGALHAARLWRWRGYDTVAEPIVLVLHAGYGFVCLGLFAIAAAAFGLMTQASAIHVFTIGALGVMTLAVMTRAALGHTGRPIVAAPPTVLAYILVGLAAIARPAADFVPLYFEAALAASGTLWLLAFAAFLWVYAPILFAPRLPRI